MDKNRLHEIAQELPSDAKAMMEARRKDRYWKAASAAIAAKIRRHIKVNGINRVKLAEMLNITPANITRYLNGTTNFELKTLVEIERALGIKIIDKTIIPIEEKSSKFVVVKFTANSQNLSDYTVKAESTRKIDYV